MRTVTGTLLSPDNTPRKNTLIVFTLVDHFGKPASSFDATTKERVAGIVKIKTDAAGAFTIDLHENTLMTDETYYKVTVDGLDDFMAGLPEGDAIDWLTFKAAGEPITPANFDLVQDKVDIAEAAALSASDDATATAADRVATGEDRVATGEDRVATGQDKTATAADRVATGEDRVVTGQDKTATAADRVVTGEDRTATGQDKTATAADRVVTGEDRTATGQDKTATAADRVQTGEDRTATGQDKTATAADRVATGQDKTATAADRVQTGEDRVQTGIDAAAAAVSAVSVAETEEVLTTIEVQSQDYVFTAAGGETEFELQDDNGHILDVNPKSVELYKDGGKQLFDSKAASKNNGTTLSLPASAVLGETFIFTTSDLDRNNSDAYIEYKMGKMGRFGNDKTAALRDESRPYRHALAYASNALYHDELTHETPYPILHDLGAEVLGNTEYLDGTGITDAGDPIVTYTGGVAKVEITTNGYPYIEQIINTEIGQRYKVTQLMNSENSNYLRMHIRDSVEDIAATDTITTSGFEEHTLYFTATETTARFKSALNGEQSVGVFASFTKPTIKKITLPNVLDVEKLCSLTITKNISAANVVLGSYNITTQAVTDDTVYIQQTVPDTTDATKHRLVYTVTCTDSTIYLHDISVGDGANNAVVIPIGVTLAVGESYTFDDYMYTRSTYTDGFRVAFSSGVGASVVGSADVTYTIQEVTDVSASYFSYIDANTGKLVQISSTGDVGENLVDDGRFENGTYEGWSQYTTGATLSIVDGKLNIDVAAGSSNGAKYSVPNLNQSGRLFVGCDIGHILGTDFSTHARDAWVGPTVAIGKDGVYGAVGGIIELFGDGIDDIAIFTYDLDTGQRIFTIDNVVMKYALPLSATHSVKVSHYGAMNHKKKLTDAEVAQVEADPDLMNEVFFNGAVLVDGFSYATAMVGCDYHPANEGIIGGKYVQNLGVPLGNADATTNITSVYAGQVVTPITNGWNIANDGEGANMRLGSTMTENLIVVWEFDLIVNSGEWILEKIVEPSGDYILNKNMTTGKHSIVYRYKDLYTFTVVQAVVPRIFDIDITNSSTRIASAAEIKNFTSNVRENFLNRLEGPSNLKVKQDKSGRSIGTQVDGLISFNGDGRRGEIKGLYDGTTSFTQYTVVDFNDIDQVYTAITQLNGADESKIWFWFKDAGTRIRLNLGNGATMGSATVSKGLHFVTIVYDDINRLATLKVDNVVHSAVSTYFINVDGTTSYIGSETNTGARSAENSIGIVGVHDGVHTDAEQTAMYEKTKLAYPTIP